MLAVRQMHLNTLRRYPSIPVVLRRVLSKSRVDLKKKKKGVELNGILRRNQDAYVIFFSFELSILRMVLIN